MFKGHRLFVTQPNRRHRILRRAAAMVVFFAFWPTSAFAPVLTRLPDVRIDHIEITAQYVTIHFYTDANRTYTVQAAANFPATDWTNIYTARALPFADHYVVADERTNTMRYYRLFVVP
jgi:hypothetical protein